MDHTYFPQLKMHDLLYRSEKITTYDGFRQVITQPGFQQDVNRPCKASLREICCNDLLQQSSVDWSKTSGERFWQALARPPLKGTIDSGKPTNWSLQTLPSPPFPSALDQQRMFDSPGLGKYNGFYRLQISSPFSVPEKS
jgi:hypothetical protein